MIIFAVILAVLWIMLRGNGSRRRAARALERLADRYAPAPPREPIAGYIALSAITLAAALWLISM